MHICYLANGNSIHTQRWIEPFVHRGDDVHLVSYVRMTRTWPDVHVIDLTRLPGPPKGKLYNWARWLRGYLRRTQPDIFHAHQVTIAGWLGALTGFHPYIVSAWGSDLLIAPHQSRWQRMKIAWTLRHCDHLTAPSPLMYEAARALGVPEKRLHLIPWGVETDIFTPEPDDRAETRRRLGISEHAHVIFCSRGIKPVYNHDTLLQATALLRPEIPDLTLCFLDFNAEPNYRAQLQQIVEAHGLSKIVHWLPAQSNREDMARLYRMADVIVSIPSSEGYGFSVYEALACQKPVVITDLPAFQAVLEDEKHVLKVPVRDAAATARAIARIFDDEPLREQLRHHARLVSEQLSITQRIQLTDHLYRQLLSSP